MLSQMNASPDVLFVAGTLHIVHCKVVGDIAEERLISRRAVKVSKLPGHGFFSRERLGIWRTTTIHAFPQVSPTQNKLAIKSCGKEYFIVVTHTFGCTNDDKPADNHGFIVPPTVVTDRLTVEHKVALVRSGSPDQLDLWGNVWGTSTLRIPQLKSYVFKIQLKSRVETLIDMNVWLTISVNKTLF